MIAFNIVSNVIYNANLGLWLDWKASAKRAICWLIVSATDAGTRAEGSNSGPCAAGIFTSLPFPDAVTFGE